MIRKGIEQDIPHIAAIYEHIHDNEECGKSTVGWIAAYTPRRIRPVRRWTPTTCSSWRRAARW